MSLDEGAVKELVVNRRAMLQLGRKPTQIEILNFLDGVDFEGAWDQRVKGVLGSHEVWYRSVEDYVAMKMAPGRATDIDDLNRLRKPRAEYGDC